MFISKLKLQNFKRFTDLTIELSNLQASPRLVLMIGANGSGKSCVFDAFECISSSILPPESELYFRKDLDKPFAFELTLADQRHLGAPNSIERRRTFYGRSAHRHVPQLTRQTVASLVDLETDSDRPRRYIEFDQRFENDVAMLMRKMFTEFFGEQSQAETLKRRYLDPINQALRRIFGDEESTALKLYSFLPPIEGKPVEILFSKGRTKEIHYDLLSSGEKEIINILVNLLNRRESYQDTIYFIDELDVHLNTALQYNLLKEITENWLPEHCQFWAASHSLGFIQYAKESAQAAILDFDQFDFDQPHVLKPQPKDTLEVYDIAVPAAVLPNLFKDKKIILCENQNDRLYNLLGLSRQLFVGVKDKNEVYLRVRKNPELCGLMDRDYLSDAEVNNIRQQFPNLFVLGYYTFENYLYHPENIREVALDFDVETYKAEITRQKNEKRDAVLLGLNQTRGGYAILKNEEKIPDKDAPQIIAQALRSDDFETFYPYFNMKKGNFSHQMLETLNLPPARLAQTRWFRAAIGKLLEAEKG